MIVVVVYLIWSYFTERKRESGLVPFCTNRSWISIHYNVCDAHCSNSKLLYASTLVAPGSSPWSSDAIFTEQNLVNRPFTSPFTNRSPANRQV